MSTSREEMERRAMTEAELTRARLAGQPSETEHRAAEHYKGEENAGGREGVEHAKQSVASGLHTTAQRVREQSQQMGRSTAGSRMAEPLDRSAFYLQTHSLPEIRNDINRTVQERPLVAAAGVFATAFLVGRLLRRR